MKINSQVKKENKFLILLMILALTCGGIQTGLATIANDSIPENSEFQAALLTEIQIESENELKINVPSLPASLNNDPVIPKLDHRLTDKVRKEIQRAHSVIEEIKKHQRYTDVLLADQQYDLPIGLKKEIGGRDYIIGIDSIVITPTGAYLVAYMSLPIPESDQNLAFVGKNIQFSKNGGLNGTVKLELLSNVEIKLGATSLMRLLSDGKTFVEWDCDGFQSLGIGAEVEISRDVLLPEDIYGEIKPEGRVTGRFETAINDWNDLVVTVSLDPFQINRLDGFGFYVDQAVFDLSDVQNAAGIVFPENYLSDDGMQNTWRGFYLKEVSVKLPNRLKKKKKDQHAERVSFAGKNIILDEEGFTGNITGSNLIQIDEGNLNKWAFSLNELHVDVFKNNIELAQFDGQIVVPVSDKTTPFNYHASIDPDDKYLFNISPIESMKFPLWKADVEIYNTSYLDIKLEDDVFKSMAYLDGKMVVGKSTKDEEGKKEKFEVAGVKFQGLKVMSYEPYIAVDYIGVTTNNDNKLSKFPISINEIGISVANGHADLHFDLGLKIGKSNNSLAAEGGFTVKSDLVIGDKQSWKFNSLELDRVSIDIDKGAFKFAGGLEWYKEDPIYGKGFKGFVEATFTPGVTIKASALFGNTPDYSYWYVDGLVRFPGGIPALGALSFHGFGGGAYKRMKMKMVKGDPSYELGETPSGLVYVPDEEVGLGVKATIEFATTGASSTLNGEATLEMAFNRNGGLNQIILSGKGEFMADLKIPGSEALKKNAEKLQKLQESKQANLLNKFAANGGKAMKFPDPPSGGVAKFGTIIQYDFANKTLHGELEVFLNVGGVMTGIGPNNRAGLAVIHFDPQDWYVHIGTPEDRLGIQLGIGPMSLKSQSYLMIGTQMSPTPAPPAEVSSILGNMDLDYMRDENALAAGGGFAFGSSLALDTGDLTFLIFYARLRAGLGFDVMLRNYGSNVRCKGRDKPMGINGWYASGQMYAYFDGEIGVKVKLFFIEGKFKILDIGAAVVLQAKLPNPAWMRGVVGGHYSILDGAIEGSCRFEVTMGEQCEIIGGSVLDGLEIISDMTPSDKESDVSVFSVGQAVFNMEIGKEFEMIDVDDVKKMFRVKLDHIRLMNGEKSIAGNLTWNEDNTVVGLRTLDILPSHKTVQLKIQVSFEEKKGGVWRTAIVDGREVRQSKELKFETGEAPSYIPASNVAFSYPLRNQYNFLKDEYNKGYVQLLQGQPDLFKGIEWLKKGRFIENGGKMHEFDVFYNEQQRRVNFDLPTTMKSKTVYQFHLVKIPIDGSINVDDNVTEGTIDVTIEEGNETSIANNTAEGTLEAKQESNLYIAHFRASSFNTFAQKVNAMQKIMDWDFPILVGAYQIGATYDMQELLDDFELNGGANHQPLIQLVADLSNKWYSKKIRPLIYKDYPINGSFYSREEAELGTIPVKAVFFDQANTTKKLEGEELENQTYFDFKGQSTLSYEFSLVSYRDFGDLKTRVSIVQNRSERMIEIMNASYPIIQFDDYKVNLNYVLPGTNQITSSQPLNLNFRW